MKTDMTLEKTDLMLMSGSATSAAANISERIGVDGDSAYEIAQRQGFPGTETEWLTSLGEPARQAAELADTARASIQGDLTGMRGDIATFQGSIDQRALLDPERRYVRADQFDPRGQVAGADTSAGCFKLKGAAVAGLNFAGDRTVRVLLRTGADTSAVGYPFSQKEGYSASMGIRCGDNLLQVQTVGGLTYSQALAANTLYNVEIVKRGDVGGETEVVVNGVSLGKKAITTVANYTPADISIGRRDGGGDYTATTFQGVVYLVEVCNYARSSEEMLLSWNDGDPYAYRLPRSKVGSGANMCVAEYLPSGIVPDRWRDSSGNGFDLPRLGDFRASYAAPGNAHTRMAAETYLPKKYQVKSLTGWYGGANLVTVVRDANKAMSFQIAGLVVTPATGVPFYIFDTTGAGDKYTVASNGSAQYSVSIDMDVLYANVSATVSGYRQIDIATPGLFVAKNVITKAPKESELQLAIYYGYNLMYAPWFADLVTEFVEGEKFDTMRRNSFCLSYTDNSPLNYVEFDTAANNILVPKNFTVIADGGKVSTTAVQNIPVRCLRSDGAEIASSLGFLFINKRTLEVKNVYHADASKLDNDWRQFGAVRRSGGALTDVGDVQIAGTFPYKVNGHTWGAPYADHRLLHLSFCFNGGKNEKVFVDTANNWITFPATFAVFDAAGKRYVTAAEQQVPLMASYFATGVPVASSGGALVINKATAEIRNIYWSELAGITGDWLCFGFVKRSTGSITDVGAVQVIGHFPCYYDTDEIGVGKDVIERNVHKQPLVAAAVYPKYTTVDGVAKVRSRFAFAFGADLHAGKKTWNNLLKYANANSYLQGIVVSGDIVGGYYREDATWFVESALTSRLPVLPTMGNHDCGQTALVADGGTNAQVYEKFIQPLEEKSALITGGKCYYFRDFPDHKVRMISLYEYDDPNDVDPVDATRWRIERCYRIFSQAQIDWLIATLEATPAGYAVLATSHQNPATLGDDLAFDERWAPQLQPFGSSTLMTGHPILDIIQAWIDGAALDKTYAFFGKASYLPPVGAVADFSARGAGEFVCHLFGHTHADAAGTFVSYPRQHFLAVTTTDGVYAGQSQFDDLPRVPDTVTEDAFNIVSIDRTARKMFVVRIGSDVTRELKDRKAYVMEY